MLSWIALAFSWYVAIGVGVWFAFRQFAYPHLTLSQKEEVGWQDVLILVFLWWLLFLDFDDECGPRDYD